MNLEKLLLLLAEIGVPEEILHEADGSWMLRQDLALSSAETVALQAKLKSFGNDSFSLWGDKDFSLNEIISAMRESR
ncbi:hypothetical protein [Rouxiella sp. Mn2063]|uniref:hypothetical protein n=1 Tax=Rouxiella sp. Mn2063 TaxID=3395262 RepID=UPI003BE1EA5E